MALCQYVAVMYIKFHMKKENKYFPLASQSASHKIWNGNQMVIVMIIETGMTNIRFILYFQS